MTTFNSGFKNSVPASQHSLERPQLVVFAFPGSINPGTLQMSPIDDMSVYTSWYAWFGWDADVGNYLNVECEWFDQNTAVVNQQSFVINGQGGSTPTPFGTAFARGPILGEKLRVLVTNLGSTVANYNFSLFGSLRPQAKTIAYEGPVKDNDLFANEITPGALTTSTSYWPLFGGNVSGSIRSIGTAGQQVRVQILQGVTGGVYFDKTYTIGTTPNDFGINMILPRVPTKMTVQNLGASVLNGIRTQWVAGEPE